MTDIKDDREMILALLAKNQPPPDAAISQSEAASETFITAKTSTTLSPETLLSRFCAAAKSNAATIAEVDMLANVPSAAAAYMRDNNIAPQLVCNQTLAKLNWQSAGINAQCRPAKSRDNCAITETIAAAADTGAMLVSNQTPYQLTHSLLPPVHLAVLSADAIMPSLPQVWSRLKIPEEKHTPLIASLFCGPSRTGDIEQTLTLGAHGPLRVHIIIYK